MLLVSRHLFFLNNFMQPFLNLGQISANIQTTLAGAERVFNLLNAAEQEKIQRMH